MKLQASNYWNVKMNSNAELAASHLMTLSLTVNAKASQVIGNIGSGNRMIAPIAGGNFSGNLLNGKVLPGGADWVLLRDDGVLKIDVRLVLETVESALIYLTYQGRFLASQQVMARLNAGEELSPDEYSLAVTAKFETGHPDFRWINDAVVVATGVQSGFSPTYEFYLIG
jgi:hypothetical protein